MTTSSLSRLLRVKFLWFGKRNNPFQNAKMSLHLPLVEYVCTVACRRSDDLPSYYMYGVTIDTDIYHNPLASYKQEQLNTPANKY